MTTGKKADASLAQCITRWPRVNNSRAAASALADCLAACGAGHPLHDLVAHEPVRNLLLGVADNSPYLWRLALNDVDRLARILGNEPHTRLADALASTRTQCARADDDDETAMACLRAAKQEAHLLIALADLGGVWDVVAVTEALTQLADSAVQSALEFLLRRAVRDGKLNIADIDNPQVGSGLVILALGKHGGRELNYSSDVDLVVFFDPQSPAIPDDVEPGPLYVRIVRSLVKLLQERTGDGYVLRVDLRLRPDPGSTAVAISLPAAFDYYETLGQNWERAAFIKARPIAGDVDIGARFIKGLAPFIWRKYFDYAAIADIHAMKRQIHAVRGHATVTVAGHDVKLGRGGIREVEFFVQTQQLIFGGRRPQLRGARTLDMLVELQKDGWVEKTAVEELSESYKYLRSIEHRLQMIADEQTQRLPSDKTDLLRFARFCGYAARKDFDAAIGKVFRTVEQHYARLFEHAPGLDAAAGSLVFTGVADDPETVETLRQLGFVDPSLAIETVRGWHFGRRAAVQSARAREVLTELVPALINSFSGSGDPDAALAGFDRALARMPAAVELFSILKSNKAVLELFGDILGGAPRLASVIAQRPHVLDAAIDPTTLQTPADENAYVARAHRILETVPGAEDFLDAMRDMAHEEKFLIGVRTLSSVIDAQDAGRAHSALASAIIAATLAHTQRRFAEEYGEVPGGRCLVLGVGKLGSRELTATSDLDLMLLYDFDEERPESDGGRKIHAVQYYTRLTQRLVSALTVATRRGALYEVDMRLRPSGRQGPVATRLASFEEYQRDEAETWEQMALTRARVIAGDESLAADARAIIRRSLCRKRDIPALQKAVFDMRRLIAQEKGENDAWDLKLASGGLIDVEFIAQFLMLREASAHPGILDVETTGALRKAMDAGALSRVHGDLLLEAHSFYSAITQMVRLILEDKFDPAAVAGGVLRRIATAVRLPDFRAVEGELMRLRRDVRAIFDRLLGPA